MAHTPGEQNGWAGRGSQVLSTIRTNTVPNSHPNLINSAANYGNTNHPSSLAAAEGNVWDSEVSPIFPSRVARCDPCNVSILSGKQEQFNQFLNSLIDNGGADGMSADPGVSEMNKSSKSYH
jgi:hypothetical protein